MPAPVEPDKTTYLGRFAVQLRAAREKSSLTGEQAAQRITECGYPVTFQTYYRWERADRQPDFNALPAISSALKIPIKNLFPVK